MLNLYYTYSYNYRCFGLESRVVTVGESPIHVSIYIITYSIIHNNSCPENPHLTLSLLYMQSIISQPTYGFSFFDYYLFFHQVQYLPYPKVGEIIADTNNSI